jgi:hypothetical protein
LHWSARSGLFHLPQQGARSFRIIDNKRLARTAVWQAKGAGSNSLRRSSNTREPPFARTSRGHRAPGILHFGVLQQRRHARTASVVSDRTTMVSVCSQ